MESHLLKSEYREQSGKSVVRKLRATGMVPAVLYGREEDTVPLAVNELELRRLLTGKWETAIVDLKIEGKVEKECNAIIKDVQQHPGSGRILHVDFQYIHRGEKIRIEVPVTLTGNPVGVKLMGGILEHGSRELTVRCLPKDFPEAIEIDVSELELQDAIHVSDITGRYPMLEFLDDPDTILANVLPPKLEVEKVVEEEEEGATEPEVIARGKEEKEESGEE